jgi:hypothetical protein
MKNEKSEHHKTDQGGYDVSQNLIYPLYTTILAVILIVLVPRKRIKHLLKYALVFGAITDVVIILILKVLDLGGYINYQSFHAFDIPFFPPLSWTIWFILFFEHMPKEKGWQIVYVLTAAIASVFFSNLLQNLGIFMWKKNNLLVPLIVYTSWFSFAKLGKDYLERFYTDDD